MGEYVNPLWKNFAPQHRVENLLLVEQNKVNYRDIRGNPYVTVSARGISNGLSDMLNDGTDFGPDTPNTQTSGIQEALNYLSPNGGKLVLTSNTLYIIHEPISADFSNSFIQIEGSDNFPLNDADIHATIQGTSDIPSGSYVLTLTGNNLTTGSGQYNCVLKNISIGGNKNINGLQLSNPNLTYVEFCMFQDLNIGLNVTAGANGANGYTGIGNVYQNSNYGLINGFGGLQEINPTFSNISTTMMQINNPSGGVIIDNPFYSNINESYYPTLLEINIDETSGTQPFPITVKGGSYFFAPASSSDTLNLITINATTSNTSSVSYISCNISGYAIVSGSVNPGNVVLFNLSTSGMPEIELTAHSMIFDNYGTLQFIGGSNPYGFAVLQMSDSVITVNNTGIVAPISNKYNQQMLVRTHNVIGLPEPSTPTVPASGTALTNTNPYAVEVYLNGGVVTEITRTTAPTYVATTGTTYTILSSSTGIALDGKTVRLDPGDSITLTYTTAPTWVWAPE